MNNQAKAELSLSVVLVSDYAAGTEKSWNDLRATLTAIARELATTSAEVECLLVEDARYARAIPQDVLAILPDLRIVPADVETSYGMKNMGIAAARAPWAAMLDVDCQMVQGWLAAALTAVNENPQVAAISGRTLYEGRSLFERVSALVQRSYLDPGQRGASQFVSNNNAVWRCDWFLRFPLPTDLGPFSSRIQSEQLLRAGAMLHFEPDMQVIHDFEGFAMDADIARNIGFGTVISRLADEEMPHARLIRLGPIAIPAIVLGKLWLHVCDSLRCARFYGLCWPQVPLAWCYALVSGVLETPGMLAAYRGRDLGETAYR